MLTVWRLRWFAEFCAFRAAVSSGVSGRPSSATTAGALEACRGALVGRGRLRAEVVLPDQSPLSIDTRLLANVLLRDLARSGRLARLRIRLQDQPGALFNVARIFHEERVNIIEVYHQRVFTTLPAKGLITDIECETRDKAHLDRLIAALQSAGYEVHPVELA